VDIIYITGHKNPDTDSISAAIAYAEYKKACGVNAIPVRLGEINKETKFVLNYFGFEVPELLTTVKTQVADLNIDIIQPVQSSISIKSAWTLMRKNNVKVLPVVDETDKFQGIISLSDITGVYMDLSDVDNMAMKKTPLCNIVETLNAKLLYGSRENFTITGRVIIAAMTPDEMEPFSNKGDIIIVGNRPDSQVKAIELGASCLIITCNGKVDPEVVELAKKRGCVVMITAADTFTTARLINQSVPIGFSMTRDNIVSFNIDDFVDDIKDRMLQTRYRSYPVLDDSKKIKGFISRYHLISQRKKMLILLDHNERSQTVDGIEQAEIVEIIDHHRLGDIQTGMPVYFKNEPLGSTSTIIAAMFFENHIAVTKPIAGILCAAILSDTISFKSPTCTDFDIKIANKLATIAEIDINSFALAMFREGTSLAGKKPEDILFQDFKEFQLGKYRIGIGQINTMDRSCINDLKAPLIDLMNEVCEKSRFHIAILLVTDIIHEGSEMLYTGKEKALVSKAFNISYSDSCVYLPAIISRKKQVVPMLSSAI
jgi:manganese-dependent inorganic pyrophosphatase